MYWVNESKYRNNQVQGEREKMDLVKSHYIDELSIPQTQSLKISLLGLNNIAKTTYQILMRLLSIYAIRNMCSTYHFQLKVSIIVGNYILKWELFNFPPVKALQSRKIHLVCFSYILIKHLVVLLSCVEKQTNAIGCHTVP